MQTMARHVNKRGADTSITDRLASLSDPRLEIIVHPKTYGIRFRYDSEKRSCAVMGESSDSDHKYYVTVKLVNCKEAKLVVSCVTNEKPYLPHPHKLIGKHCKDGVFRGAINDSYVFRDLGIVAVKKEDAQESLDLRKTQHVDPFGKGYKTEVDYSAVRLCFQTFIQKDGSFHPLPTVVSKPIMDNKKHEKLCILRTSCKTGPAHGGTDVMIFCTKLNTKQKAKKASTISVEFLECDDDSKPIATVAVKPEHTHHQVGVYFKTPAYSGGRLTEPHMVNYRLCCESQVSDLESFVYQPSDIPIVPSTHKKSKVEPKEIPDDIPLVLLNDSLGSSETTQEMKADALPLKPSLSEKDEAAKSLLDPEVEFLSNSIEKVSLEAVPDEPAKSLLDPDLEFLSNSIEKVALEAAPVHEFFIPSGVEENEQPDASLLGQANIGEADGSIVTHGQECAAVDDSDWVAESQPQAATSEPNPVVALKLLADGSFTKPTDADLADKEVRLIFAERKPNGEYQIVAVAPSTPAGEDK